MTAVRIKEIERRPFFTPKTLAELLNVSPRTPMPTVQSEAQSGPATLRTPGAWPTRLERDDMAEGICRIKGCERDIGPRGHWGWCSAHYQSWLKYADPTIATRRPPVLRGASTEVRFWAKVDKSGPLPSYAPHLGPCWLWTAGLIHGYGRFSNDGHIFAHRFSYELHVGPVPEGLELDHLCRVPRCVNPGHLEPVTQEENRARIPVKTHCPQGHAYAGDNLTFNRKGARECRTCARTEHRERVRREAGIIDPRMLRVGPRQRQILRSLTTAGPLSAAGLTRAIPGLHWNSAKRGAEVLRRRGFVVGDIGGYALTDEGRELVALFARVGGDAA